MPDVTVRNPLLEPEYNVRPNRYAIKAIRVIPVILLTVCVLAQLGIYDAVSIPICWGSFALSLLLIYVPSRLVHNPETCRKDSTKYVIISSTLLLTLELSVTLNSYVALVLVLPMMMATIYNHPRIVRLTWGLSCLVCLISAPLAYLLQTWSADYLQGYLSIACRVQVIVAPKLNVDLIGDMGQIMLFLTLPQLMIVGAFGIIFLSIATNGEAGLRRQAELTMVAATDPLTGLYTRSMFIQMVQQQLKDHPENDPLLVVCDIDHFSLYNDMFGHEAGDAVLQRLSDALRSYVGSAGICGRLQDDSLVVLYKDASCFDEAGYETHVLKSPKVVQDGSYRLVLHAGVYRVTDPSLDVSIMCDRAVTACGTIKDSYQQSVAYYDASMRDRTLRELQMTVDLASAFRNDELTVYLQPQCTRDSQLHGAECLVRWQHPERGIIYPMDFIPLCEKNGMISDLDRIVWKKSCALLRQWRDKGYAIPHLSVNVSAQDLYRMDVCAELTELIQRYQLQPSDLNVEITETSVTKDIENKIRVIDRLRSAGFHVEMDDFGSGDSSLSMLQQIHVDTLKLDVAFCRSLITDPSGLRILRTITKLAHDLHLSLICEGVETREQVELLTDTGCEVFQGYYFGRPMEISAFERIYFTEA